MDLSRPSRPFLFGEIALLNKRIFHQVRRKYSGCRVEYSHRVRVSRLACVSYNVRRKSRRSLRPNSGRYFYQGSAVAARVAADWNIRFLGVLILTADSFRTSLQKRLDSAAGRVLLRVICSREDHKSVDFTGPQLAASGVDMARRYCDAPPGSVVLLLLPHAPELFLLHLGLVLCGYLPAILAWPTGRVDPEKYERNLLHQLQSLPAAQIITVPQLAKTLEPCLAYRVTACHVTGHHPLERALSSPFSIEPVEKSIPSEAPKDAPKDALFLQFSGGTTAAQKCVVVTAGMLESQVRHLTEALQFTSADGVASWLPLYHDMGLIACFWLPLLNLAPSTQFAAMDWLMSPGMLFRLMSKYAATFCWMPNFAFSYLATHKRRLAKGVNLRHVRAWINCSEPVRKKSLQAFSTAFAELGVRPEQCHASYAMAENVFAVSQTPLNSEPHTISRALIQDNGTGQKQSAYELLDDVYVSSGSVLNGTNVRIRGLDGRPCHERVPGQIEIRGRSLFCGYWGNPGFSRNSLTADGWYATGDYGFTERNQIFVIGRIKDIIIIGGQNIYAEDIEAVANSVDGVYPGRVVAFGIDDPAEGTQHLVVVAEMRGEFEMDRARVIQRGIQRLVASATGVTAREVKVVSERWIVKSTAGKISRRETRERFLEDVFNARVHRGGRIES